MQRELHANNVEHETLDGLCFRGEQLARQVARLVTVNDLDSSKLSKLHHFRLRKINFLFTTSGKWGNGSQSSCTNFWWPWQTFLLDQ